jgi:hypothetical protein
LAERDCVAATKNLNVAAKQIVVQIAASNYQKLAQ